MADENLLDIANELDSILEKLKKYQAERYLAKMERLNTLRIKCSWHSVECNCELCTEFEGILNG